MNDHYKLRKTIEDIQEGDSLSLTEAIDDSQLMLYLGMTKDTNPLNLLPDYAKQTHFKKPVIPSGILMNIMLAAVSKHLPGAGSHVVNISSNFIEPVYHDETITFHFEVIKIDKMKGVVTISVEATKKQDEDNNRIIDAVIMVRPPQLVVEEEEGGILNESSE